jgi:hypothetical protein
MVPVSLETSFSARNLFKEFLSRSSAFALEPCSQSFEFEPIGFDFCATKELPIACYSDMVYSDVNTDLKSVRNLVDVDIIGKRDIEEHLIILVDSDSHSLPRPNEIFSVIFWNGDWNFNSAFNGCQFHFGWCEDKCSFIKIKRHEFFESWFGTFICFDGFQSLRCNTNSVDYELCGEIEFLSCIVVTEVVEFIPIFNLCFESFVNDESNGFGILFHHFENSFVRRNFQFNCCHRLHEDTLVAQIYKYLDEGSPMEVQRQFLPSMNAWVSLPTFI